MSLATMALGQAKAALARNGAAATLTNVTTGAYSSTTGTNAAGTTTNNSTYAVLDASSLQGLGYKYGHDLVQGGDLEATIAAKGLTISPLPGDTLTIGSTVYTLIAVKPTFMAATPIIYTLLVRR